MFPLLHINKVKTHIRVWSQSLCINNWLVELQCQVSTHTPTRLSLEQWCSAINYFQSKHVFCLFVQYSEFLLSNNTEGQHLQPILKPVHRGQIRSSGFTFHSHAASLHIESVAQNNKRPSSTPTTCEEVKAQSINFPTPTEPQLVHSAAVWQKNREISNAAPPHNCFALFESLIILNKQ